MSWFALGFYALFGLCLVTGGTILNLNPGWFFLIGTAILILNKAIGGKIP